jgi:hypothetical protein
MKRALRLVPLAVVALLAVPATALAGNASSSSTLGTSGGPSDPEGIAGSVQSLPFTGLNLALVIVVGLALVATGIFLRRRGSSAA